MPVKEEEEEEEEEEDVHVRKYIHRSLDENRSVRLHNIYFNPLTLELDI